MNWPHSNFNESRLPALLRRASAREGAADPNPNPNPSPKPNPNQVRGPPEDDRERQIRELQAGPNP